MTLRKLQKPKDDAEFCIAGEAYNTGRVTPTGVIKGVHLLGFESKNGRTYSQEAIKAAVEAKLYNDVSIFINHDENDTSRNNNAKDKLGFILESYFDEKHGLIGDVQLNTGHPHYKATVWWLENHPEKVGFSHVAPITESKDRVVTAIGKPFSVDLVSTPATTKGMVAREGVIEDEIQEDRLCAIHSAIVDLFFDIKYPLTGPMLTQEEQALQYIPVLQDAIAELTKLGNSKTPTTEQESVMELDKLTLDELKAKRPDLITSINAEAVAAERALDTAVAEATKELSAEAKTPVFMKLIRESLASNKPVADLVADRKAVATSVVVESAPARSPEVPPAAKTSTFDADAFEKTILSK